MMTTTSILLSHLRRSRPYYSLLPTLFSAHQSNPRPLSPPPHTRFTPRVNPFLFHSRAFSTPLGGGDVPFQEDSILPVRHLISLLDAYHDLTGLPWWIVIASSTVALRVVLFPVLIFQLNKLKRIGELFPKLPPPFPPPLSGKSYIDQISLFQRERRAIGCPSFLWFLAYFSIQVPCFFLWMTSIRRMSLDHHPGFDCGGALWFQNLTEFSHGVSGPIFPLLIAGLHYINVQISFGTSSVRNVTGPLDLLAKFFKFYLNFLTLPLFFIGYCIPQGSLVYWVTNSSFSVIQVSHCTVFL
nr:ALBINO3-like protein 2, chloroplastic [Quercus suber]